jgi:aminopeptidase C
VIYYTGVHPYTLQPIKTVKTKEEKLNQNRFFFWYKRENRDWIKQRLQKANQPELAAKLLGDAPEKKIPKWLEEKRRKK